MNANKVIPVQQSYIRNKYELDSFQIKAFDSIDSKRNVIVSAPTGSGKTTVADYAIECAKQSNPKATIIYTCPIKALCNEKYRDMVLSWGSEPFNYKIGLIRNVNVYKLLIKCKTNH
jgi:ATP-dependent RNA helicase HelY